MKGIAEIYDDTSSRYGTLEVWTAKNTRALLQPGLAMMFGRFTCP